MGITFNKDCQPLEPAKLHKSQPVIGDNKKNSANLSPLDVTQPLQSKKLKLDVYA